MKGCCEGGNESWRFVKAGYLFVSLSVKCFLNKDCPPWSQSLRAVYLNIFLLVAPLRG
jgi:hypothetical protein